MIICALEESVPFIVGYSGLGKKKVKSTTLLRAKGRSRQVKAGLSTPLQDIAPSDSGSFFKAVYSSGVI